MRLSLCCACIVLCGLAPAALGETMRIATYNIHHAEGNDGAVDLDRIAVVVRELDADVVCLQEVDQNLARTQRMDFPARLSEMLGMEAVYGPNLQFGGGAYGNLTLSRYPVVARRNVALPGPEEAEPRGALFATIRVNGTDADIVNTHWGLHPDERAQQGRALLDAVRAVPTVLAGDFNENEAGAGMALLLGRFASVFDSGERDVSGTYPAHPEEAARKRIDFILHSGDFEAAAARVITGPVAKAASDHYPVVADLRLAEAGAPDSAFLPEEDLVFLEELAAAVLEASRVPPGAKVGDIGPNTTGYTVIRPGGRNAYPAFWIRDYAMSLDMGMITPEEQRHALLLTATHQPDAWTPLPSGSVLPPGSVADHISFGNVPIFFPGILEDYQRQGGERWGKLPSLDDHFYFVHMAAAYVRQTGDIQVLETPVRGRTLLERLEMAYRMPPSREESGLVYADADNRGVNFGFFDTTVHTGGLFFCSVLKHRAARELAELLDTLGREAEALRYREQAAALRQALHDVFALDSGLYRASTGLSAQPDVWGTAFAVYTGALPKDAVQTACKALARLLKSGTMAWRGAIRHVPEDADFSAETAWEKSFAPKNRYQNGAYWKTPVGWVCYAVHRVDPAAARGLARAYVAQLRSGDFRKGPEHGAPWECMHPEENHRQNPVYLTSVSCPLAAFRRIME